MTTVKKSRKVNFSCEQMYNLVNDVERYAEFLPYFSRSEVHHRDADEVQATLVIVAAGMSKSFTTRNRLQANKMIEIRLVDGPFSHLEGFWRFDPINGNGCLISFDLLGLSTPYFFMKVRLLFSFISTLDDENSTP